MNKVVVLVRYVQKSVKVRGAYGSVTVNSYLVVGDAMERWPDIAMDCL